jgi:hypothetical protein
MVNHDLIEPIEFEGDDVRMALADRSIEWSRHCRGAQVRFRNSAGAPTSCRANVL